MKWSLTICSLNSTKILLQPGQNVFRTGCKVAIATLRKIGNKRKIVSNRSEGPKRIQFLKWNKIDSEDVAQIQNLADNTHFLTIDFIDVGVLLLDRHHCLIIEEFAFLQRGKKVVVLVSETDETFQNTWYPILASCYNMGLIYKQSKFNERLFYLVQINVEKKTWITKNSLTGVWQRVKWLKDLQQLVKKV